MTLEEKLARVGTTSKTQCLNVVVRSQASWILLVDRRQISSCHCFFIVAMVFIALLLSSRTFLLALLSLFIARVVTPAFGAFACCGRPSCTSVPCSDSAGTTDTCCDSSASRRRRDVVLLQGRWTRFHIAEVCLASRRTSQVNGHRSTLRDFALQQNAQSRRQGWYKGNKPLRRWSRTWERSYIVD